MTYLNAAEKSKLLWLGWAIRYHLKQIQVDETYLEHSQRPDSITLRYPAEGYDLLAHSTSTLKRGLHKLERKYTRKDPKHIDARNFPSPKELAATLSGIGARMAFLPMKMPNVELYGLCYGNPKVDDYSFRLEIPKSRTDLIAQLEPYRFSHKDWG